LIPCGPLCRIWLNSMLPPPMPSNLEKLGRLCCAATGPAPSVRGWPGWCFCRWSGSCYHQQRTVG
jgi:hypothetical protein